MANIYDVNAAIGQPNIVGAFQQGLQFGRQQRDQRIADEQKQQLRNLAPQVVAGDPDAYNQAAAIAPKEAQDLQGAGDAQLRRARGLITYLENADKSGNPEVAQAAWQQYGVPFARQFSQGTEPTPNWSEAKPMVEQLKARISLAENANNSSLPTGFRELDLTARAAGFQPGTPEYQRAARIGLGIDPRAVTAAPKTGSIAGADGRPRPFIFDPASMSYRVFDSGQWREMGPQEVAQAQVIGAAAQEPSGLQVTSPGAPQSVDGTVDTGGMPVITIPNATPEQNAAIAQVVQAMRAAQSSEDEINAYIAGQDARFNPAPARTPAPTQAPQARPDLLTGRTPEEEAAAKRIAEDKAALQNYDAMTEAITRREAATALAKKQAETASDVSAKQGQRTRDADETIALLNQAEALLPQATGSAAGSAVDRAAAAFGYSTPGAQATAQLNLIASRLTQKVPRFEGPQSNIDVQSYREAAGDLSNPSLPVETRMAALRQLRALNEKYATQPSASSPGAGRYQVGQVIEANGRRYRVTGGDLNDPDVEEVR